MSTSFIKQCIDMRIYDIKYHVSQQIVDIVKLMVHIEVQHARELESKQVNNDDNYVTSPLIELKGTKLRHTLQCKVN